MSKIITEDLEDYLDDLDGMFNGKVRDYYNPKSNFIDPVIYVADEIDSDVDDDINMAYLPIFLHFKELSIG